MSVHAYMYHNALYCIACKIVQIYNVHVKGVHTIHVYALTSSNPPKCEYVKIPAVCILESFLRQ